MESTNFSYDIYIIFFVVLWMCHVYIFQDGTFYIIGVFCLIYVQNRYLFSLCFQYLSIPDNSYSLDLFCIGSCIWNSPMLSVFLFLFAFPVFCFIQDIVGLFSLQIFIPVSSSFWNMDFRMVKCPLSCLMYFALTSNLWNYNSAFLFSVALQILSILLLLSDLDCCILGTCMQDRYELLL